QHRALAMPLRPANGEQWQQVAQALRLPGDLDDRGAGAAHVAYPIGEVTRHTFEVMQRADHARHPIRRTQPAFDADRAILDVDELGAGVECLPQNPLALLFRSLEVTALPCRPARHDDRTPPPFERPGDIW